MTSLDKSNRPERIWNDPPMPDDPPLEITLGAGVPPETRKLFELFDTTMRRQRMISNILTAATFPMVYAVSFIFPELTSVEILTCLIMTVVMITVVEVGHYYKLI